MTWDLVTYGLMGMMGVGVVALLGGFALMGLAIMQQSAEGRVRD